jgi:hypothetical protein
MTERSNSLFALKLWYKPRKAMQGLIEAKRGHGAAMAVSVLFGLAQIWPMAVAEPARQIDLYAVGASAGLSAFFLFGWLLRNFGRWFGGRAQVREVRTAFGLGLLPWLVLFVVLGAAIRMTGDSPEFAGLFWVFFAGLVYGYGVLLLSLSAALRISVWKTFFCLVVTSLVSIFPLTLLLQILAPELLPAQ